jgi:hypothetical protein
VLRPHRLLGMLLFAAVTAIAAPADEADRQVLLAGVSEIAAPGWPGCLSVYGPDAFVVITGKANDRAQAPVAAAARLGQGRLFLLGHNGYFGAEALQTGGTATMLVNAVHWLAGDREPLVAVQGLDDIAALLEARGLKVARLEGDDWHTSLGQYDVLITTRPPGYSAAEVAAVEAFIRVGGGLLSGDTPWGWLQLNPGKSLTADHGGNKLVAAAGVVWSDGGLGRTSGAGFAAATPGELVHAGTALAAIEANVAGQRELSPEDLAQATWSVTQAARTILPGDTLLRPRLRELQQAHAEEAVPTTEKPLEANQPLARLALTLQLEDLAETPAAEVQAHPAAAAFPGTVAPEAPRVTREVVIGTSVPGWHGTGLYAAPGEAVTITVPAAAAESGLQVHLGCHTDKLWGLDTWKRAPQIVRRFPLKQPVTAVANAFGGLIYVDVPDNCELGSLTVQIGPAVEAARFVLGKTDLTQWQSTMRQAPAPWAELESSKLVLTVPAMVVRTLDDPAALMEFWSRVADACNELICRPPERKRPERIVADVQISAGYMHSGYPIMTHLDAAEFGTDLARLTTKGSWGHFHELGHNHQSGDWTFGGTGEVTVNLFTLYILSRCCAVEGPGHPAITGEQREKKTRDYLAGGRDFEQWKKDPFLALIMYAQLQEGFGWDAYQRVFAEYAALPAEQRPKTDDEKRDQWLVRFSRTVARNLGPFFEAWGVPTSQEARDGLKDLPEWLPEGFPPPD